MAKPFRRLAHISRPPQSYGLLRLRLHDSRNVKHSCGWPLEMVPNKDAELMLRALWLNGYDIRGFYDLHVREWEKLTGKEWLP
jgi:hypothetical protein